MSAPQTKPHKLGQGALRTHRFLLDQGGWWDVRELAKALDLSDSAGVYVQIQALLNHRCVARKGTGVSGDPYRYGVTAACTDPTKL